MHASATAPSAPDIKACVVVSPSTKEITKHTAVHPTMPASVLLGRKEISAPPQRIPTKLAAGSPNERNAILRDATSLGDMAVAVAWKTLRSIFKPVTHDYTPCPVESRMHQASLVSPFPSAKVPQHGDMLQWASE